MRPVYLHLMNELIKNKNYMVLAGIGLILTRSQEG